MEISLTKEQLCKLTLDLLYPLCQSDGNHSLSVITPYKKIEVYSNISSLESRTCKTILTKSTPYIDELEAFYQDYFKWLKSGLIF